MGCPIGVGDKRKSWGIKLKRLLSYVSVRPCRRGDPKKVAMAVLFIGALAFLIVVACGESSVSRRLVNLPYIALQVNISSTYPSPFTSHYPIA